LATALTFLSTGLYFVWWFGASWAEIKRERADPTMRPIWHALTSVVPVYASFRTHAHFRALASLVRPKVEQIPDRAAWATWLVSFAWLTGYATLFFRGISGLVLAVVSAALYAVVVYRGQKDFNAYIRVTGGEEMERAHAMESIGLVLAVVLTGFLIYDDLTFP
jgi:hypothetical protein